MTPEQKRAMAFVDRVSNVPLADVRKRVERYFGSFAQRLDGLDEATAKTRTAPDRWSIHEVVDHLVASNEPAVGQLRSLIAGQSVTDAVPAGLQSAAPLDVPWHATRDALAALDRQILGILDEAHDGLPTTATAPIVMVVKTHLPDGTSSPIEWIERFAWKPYAVLLGVHTREHQDQVDRIREALGG